MFKTANMAGDVDFGGGGVKAVISFCRRACSQEKHRVEI